MFEVWVYPDEFYERFFSNMLNAKQPENGLREELQKALDAARGSQYLLYKRELRLTGS